MVEFTITRLDMTGMAHDLLSVAMTVSSSSGNLGTWLFDMNQPPRPARLLLWKPDTFHLPVMTDMLSTYAHHRSPGDYHLPVSGFYGIDISLKISFPVFIDKDRVFLQAIRPGASIYILPLRDNRLFS